MKFSRRDLLAWSAGAAAGLIVTPIPWKLLDDTSIWSQNWRWIPQPSRGPVETKQSFCTLCPKGCALRVRMAAGWPVGVAGVATNPVTRGALCPLAFGAHQLNWHPARLKVVRHRGSASTWENARDAFAKAASEGAVVLIDGYPGRAASQLFQDFLKSRRGEYRVVYTPEAQSLLPYEQWSGVPASSLGYDLQNARTIISFGAPLLDAWGPPGQFTQLWAERAAGQNDPQIRLIQVDSEISRTAARAWKWIEVHPGSESVLAAGLARALVEQNLVSVRGPLPPISVADAAGQTGLAIETIRDLAQTLVAQRPTLAMAERENASVAALNLLLNAVGQKGGIVRTTKDAKTYFSADAEFASARAVLIDATVPWDFVPNPNAEIFRFAGWDGGGDKFDWLLPAPGFLEELTDVPSAPASSLDTYAIAPALSNVPPYTKSAAEFLRSFDPGLSTVDDIIHQRCVALFKARSGRVCAGTATMPTAGFASEQKFEEQLRGGAVWVGDPLRDASFRCKLTEWPGDTTSPPMQDWSAVWPSGTLPPLASKLYQESQLRDAPERRNA